MNIGINKGKIRDKETNAIKYWGSEPKSVYIANKTIDKSIREISRSLTKIGA